MPKFSLQECKLNGDLVRHWFFTRLLSDHYGIPARGGCAGSYARRLHGFDRVDSYAHFGALSRGVEFENPVGSD
jgi:hypothetical protein